MGVMGTLLGRRPSNNASSSATLSASEGRQPPSPEAQSFGGDSAPTAAVAAVNLNGSVTNSGSGSGGAVAMASGDTCNSSYTSYCAGSGSTETAPVSYEQQRRRQQQQQQMMIGDDMEEMGAISGSSGVAAVSPARRRLPSPSPMPAGAERMAQNLSQQPPAGGGGGQFQTDIPSASVAETSANALGASAAAALAALPPPGQSGPTSFRFSPPCPALDGPSYASLSVDGDVSCKSLGGRYLTFLSASGGCGGAGDGGDNDAITDMATKMMTSQPRNVALPTKSALKVGSLGTSSTASAIPSVPNGANGATSTAAASVAAGAASAIQRRLCVIDLEPFTRDLGREEEQYYASLVGGGEEQKKKKKSQLDDSTATNSSGRSMMVVDAEHDDSHEDGERAPLQGEVVVDRRFTIGSTSSSSAANGARGDLKATPSLPLTDPSLLSQQYIEPLLRLPPPAVPPHPSLSPEATGMRGSQKIAHERPSPSMEHGHRNKRRERVASRGATTASLQDGGSEHNISLAERLRRERQRLFSTGVTQFGWSRWDKGGGEEGIRIIVPHRGNVYVQDGIGPDAERSLRVLYDKTMLQNAAAQNSELRRSGRRRGASKECGAVAAAHAKDFGAIDPQLSPDGTMVAFVVASEIYVMGCEGQALVARNGADIMDVEASASVTDKYYDSDSQVLTPLRLTFGAVIGENNQDDHDEDDDEENDDTDGFSANSTDDDASETGTEYSDPEIYDAGVGDSLGQASRTQRRRGRRRRKSRTNRRRRNRNPPSVTHGLADFVAQEEMDRYRGFWWDPSSSGIVFARVDESDIPPFRITHQGKEGSFSRDAPYEDHRYPFAGEANPVVRLGYVKIDRKSIPGAGFIECSHSSGDEDASMEDCNDKVDESTQRMLADARTNWNGVRWFDPPPVASEYLARVSWLPDGSACAQWQDRAQSALLLVKMDPLSGRTSILHKEFSDVWINLHHNMKMLPRAIHPDEIGDFPSDRKIPNPLPEGSFSFLFASERTGYSHVYLYTHVGGTEQYLSDSHYAPGDDINEPEIAASAVLLRAISAGPWVVESIVGVDVTNDVVYVTGTYDSPLERHLYALPIIGSCARKGGVPDNGGTGVQQWRKRVVPSFSSVPASRSFRKSPSGSSCSSVGEGTVTSHKTPNEVKADAAFKLAGIPGPKPPDPTRLTIGRGMHNIAMDEACRIIVDTTSDLDKPTCTSVYALPVGGPFAFSYCGGSETKRVKDGSAVRGTEAEAEDDDARTLRLLFVAYEAQIEDNTDSLPAKLSNIVSGIGSSSRLFPSLSPPEIISFSTSDCTETLYAALYKPDPTQYGPGPYPLVCAVYGGPHVQRVNRSWSQSADMRAQHLRSLGFAVIKCDNRGSSRRGVAFEGAIRKRLGRLEVLDQVAAVRHLTHRGVADPSRVGIYGWSYGGYLSAMCLVRAPDVFHVAVAGAPVTSWDGYDTHYTERYMGLPSENSSGYRESAVFDHVPNMRGKLMIVHGLIDENVHFRHTARLINRLIAAGKDYDLLIFPDERHSPRRLRDRIYMEKRISDYLVKNLLEQQSIGVIRRVTAGSNADGTMPGIGGIGVRQMPKL